MVPVWVAITAPRTEVGVAVDVGVGGVGALDLGDGGVGADQGVEPALGVADVGDAVGAVDGQGVDGGGAEGAHLPLVGGQSLVHGGAVGEVDGLNLKPLATSRPFSIMYCTGRQLRKGMTATFRTGSSASAAGATVGAGGGLLGVAAAQAARVRPMDRASKRESSFFFMMYLLVYRLAWGRGSTLPGGPPPGSEESLPDLPGGVNPLGTPRLSFF